MDRKLSGELEYRIRYDVEHYLFSAQNVFNDEYIKPTFIEYVQKLEKEKSEIINLINDCLWSCVNKNFDKVEEGLKSLLNEYDE